MTKNKPKWAAHKKSTPIAPVITPRTPLTRKDKLVFLLLGVVILCVSAFFGYTTTDNTGGTIGDKLHDLESILARRDALTPEILSWELIEGNETLTLVMEVLEGTSAEKIELWSGQFKQEARSRMEKADMDWEYEVEVR